MRSIRSPNAQCGWWRRAYREANRSLWRLTILPLAGKIFGALAQGLAPWRPGVTIGVDVDGVPELSEDRERLWTMVSGADWLSAEEKRAAVGLGAQ